VSLTHAQGLVDHLSMCESDLSSNAASGSDHLALLLHGAGADCPRHAVIQ